MTQATITLPPPLSGTLLVVADAANLRRELRLLYLSWLDMKETSRFHGIKNQQIADCFLVGRAIVKQVVAGFAGGAPERVCLTVSSSGKPQLANELAITDSAMATTTHFSISHKSTVLAIAFAGEPVGVDIEPIIEGDKLRLARRFFSAQEADGLQALGCAARRDQFTRIWVLKEACVKRDGSTLAERIGQVGFSVDDESIQCHGASGSGQYQLYQFNIGLRHGYLGVATSVGYGKQFDCYCGLPSDGYLRRQLALVASS